MRKTLHFSLKETKDPKDQEKKRLHAWLVKEQAAYIKEHGIEGIDTLDWDRYIKTHFRG